MIDTILANGLVFRAMHQHYFDLSPTFWFTTSAGSGTGWEDHCLYNQETSETPQLYFSHMLKTGDPYALAKQVRRGLDRTASE